MGEPTSASSGTKTLRPRARILRTLGDELISSEIVALLELVKNSYDADATRVLVKFHGPTKTGGPKIEVIDNGQGMSLETIQTTWMEPATPSRKQEPRSRTLERRVLGEKGIGRFATSRLANFLEVVTRPTASQRQTRVYFDWAQFDQEERFLDEIEILWEEGNPTDMGPGGAIEQLWDSDEIRPPQGPAHGTILRMEELRNDWGAREFDGLRNGLSRLISPFFENELTERNDQFEIRLELPPPFEEQSGTVGPPELLRNPHYNIRGTIDSEGRYDLTVNLRDTIGEETIRGEFKPTDNKPSCGPIELEFRIWDRDRDSMSDLAHHYSLESTTQARRVLDAAAGISVYRDGFRVLPYGEPHNDWLRLDMRRVQNPTLRLSNNQILGYVIISSETNPQLRDQSNREGLMENPALEDLRELIILILAIIETRRFKLRHPPESQRGRGTGGLFVGLNIEAVRTYAAQHHPDDHQLIRLVADAERNIDNRTKGIQEVLSRYHRLASLGQLIDKVLHDGRAPLAKIGNEATLGLRDVDRFKQGGEAATEKLKGRLIAILNQSNTLASLFRKIEPFGGRKRGRPERLTLEKVIAEAFSVLDTEIEEIGVRTNLPDTNTTVTVDPVDIQRVIMNLLQNSLYWLRQVPPERREVTVEVNRQGPNEVEVFFSDSGPGVAADSQEQIFEPYFSTKPDGVGLGLTMAGEIITDYYDGVLELLENDSVPGTSFRFTLCRRV